MHILDPEKKNIRLQCPYCTAVLLGMQRLSRHVLTKHPKITFEQWVADCERYGLDDVVKRANLDPALKQRKKPVKNPIVTSYRDIKANSGCLTRLLYRSSGKHSETVFPEFALYHDKLRGIKLVDLKQALLNAGFTQDPTEKSRYILRTNKFNLFVFVPMTRS